MGDAVELKLLHAVGLFMTTNSSCCCEMLLTAYWFLLGLSEGLTWSLWVVVSHLKLRT